MRSCMPPPGAPELLWMLAPATLPCSAWSTVEAGARLRSSVLTEATELATCLRASSLARPTTTISSTKVASSDTVTVSRLAPTVTSRSLWSWLEKSSVIAPSPSAAACMSSA
mgnify:CR=1 FL=1